MKRILFAAAFLALTTGAALAQKAVRLGTEAAYEPYNFIAESGRIEGFERDLGDRICAIAGYRCEWVKNDWETIIPNLLGGRYDVILAAMSITEERRRQLEFSQEYLPPSPSAFLARQGATVAGGKIGVQTQTVQETHIVQSSGTAVSFATADEAVEALRSGKVDAVLADKEFLVKFAGKEGLAFVGEDLFIGGGIAAGTRKEDAELRAAFDAAIAAMKQDGSLNKLIDKWFPGANGF